MNEEVFNTQVRRFLKEVGITSQREMEKAVQDAVKAGRLQGDEKLKARMVFTVEGLDLGSPQPDRRIGDVLAAFGASVRFEDGEMTASGGITRGADLDLGDTPDLAPLVGALGCLAPGVTTVRGAPHLRIKESDRIASTVAAARALGCSAEERPDGFVIHGGGARGGAVIDPCGDHRLAMAFAIAGAALDGVRVLDPGCVTKSYPGFWDALGGLLSVPDDSRT